MAFSRTSLESPQVDVVVPWEGARDGTVVAESGVIPVDGAMLGTADGASKDMLLGANARTDEGASDGALLSVFVEGVEGARLGTTLGINVGAIEGESDGKVLET